jgi:hypothetical protein
VCYSERPYLIQRLPAAGKLEVRRRGTYRFQFRKEDCAGKKRTGEYVELLLGNVVEGAQFLSEILCQDCFGYMGEPVGKEKGAIF